MITASSTAAVAWADVRAELVRFVGARVAAADVDDVVQDALAKVHAGLAGVRDHDRLAAWIYQVARNAIVDHLRRARPNAPLAAEPPAPEDAPLDDATAQMLARCMTAFVALLPPVLRQAIALVELEGLSQVESAARLGVPLSTMKSRVQRGRAQLRELVEACCAIDLDVRGHVIDATPRRGTCCAPASAD